MRKPALKIPEVFKQGADGRRTTVARLVVGLVLCGVAVGGWFAWDRSRQLPDDAVLRYGDITVTERDLQARVDVLGALYGVVRPDDANEASEFDRLAAKSYAVSLVIDAAGADRGIEISDKEARDQLDALIDDQLTGGRATFVQFLEDSRISEKDVLDEIARQLLTARLIQEVAKDVDEVTDDDVVSAFEANRGDFAVPESRKLSNIVVADRAQANEVRRLAGQGRNFASLARKYSRDASTREQGGLLGTLTRDQLEEGFAEVAFAAAPGTVFGPVETRFGWNVGRVVSVSQPRQLTFEEVKAELRTQLENKKRLAKWRDYLGDLLVAADVEYATAYEPADPDSPPSDEPSVDLGGETADEEPSDEGSGAQ